MCQTILLRLWRQGFEGRERGFAGQGTADRRQSICRHYQVLRLPYLLGFCLFVFLLASVTTFLYFDQLRLVKEAIPNEDDRTQVFARIDFVVQALTLFTQVFFTGRIASRLGRGGAADIGAARDAGRFPDPGPDQQFLGAAQW